MQNILIIGDSYSDTYIDQHQWKTWKTWPNVLTEKYNVTNLSKHGSGPNWALEQLKHYENNNTTSDTILIFFISHPLRPNFKFFSSPHHQNLNWLNKDNKNSAYMQGSYRRFLPFLTNFIKFNDLDLELEVLKYVSYLKTISFKYKKVLVFSNFFDIDNTIFCSINTNKFFVVKDRLRNLTRHQDENSPNHISQETHYQMIEWLEQYIENSTRFDISCYKHK